jgi:hypothetical protein
MIIHQGMHALQMQYTTNCFQKEAPLSVGSSPWSAAEGGFTISIRKVKVRPEKTPITGLSKFPNTTITTLK